MYLRRMQRRFFKVLSFPKLKYFTQQLQELEGMTDIELQEEIELEKLELMQKRDDYLNSEFMKNQPKSALFEMRAGAGGEESSLFVKELGDMYKQFFSVLNWNIQVMEEIKSTNGFKQSTFRLPGEAYRYIQYESGVHRVQRIPLTDSKGRIHTSTITIAVIPEHQSTSTTIKEEDLEIQTYRSSGKGGQHVNKTESAVRIKHVPTGFVVANQDERSQHKNKQEALKTLQFRIHQHYTKIAFDLAGNQRKDQIGSGGRNERIRTYNYPQSRITDHRISATIPLLIFKQGQLLQSINYSNSLPCHHFGDLIYELTRQYEWEIVKSHM